MCDLPSLQTSIILVCIVVHGHVISIPNIVHGHVISIPNIVHGHVISIPNIIHGHVISSLQDWCNSHFISKQNMKKVIDIRKQLKQICSSTFHQPFLNCDNSDSIR